MQKITPFLWFNNNAEEAIDFYTSVFPDAAIGIVNRYSKGGPAPEGSLMTASITLMGQDFIVLNGGPHYTFTPAVSFVVSCANQDEIDHYWEKLSEGGEKSRCGWLVDKFGLSWQVVPSNMGALLGQGDGAKRQRTMQAMMTMDKIDIAALENA